MTLNLEIRELEISDELSFKTAKNEWDDSNDFLFVPRSEVESNYSFTEYVQMLKDQRLGKNLPENYVSDTCHFAFQGKTIVGRVSLRHELNDFLLKVGGHVGYGVVPRHRGKGIATALLEHAKKEAKEIGLKKLLITCDEDNTISAKVIEKCGGKLEDIVSTSPSEPKKKRYWIELI